MTERSTIDPLTGEVVSDPAISPFAAWLQAQASGKTHDELSEALWDLTERVRDTGKRGTLALTITVEPLKDDPSVLCVSDEIRVKLPEYPRPASIYWRDRNGNLSRQNPAQPELSGLRAISADPDPSTFREVK